MRLSLLVSLAALAPAARGAAQAPGLPFHGGSPPTGFHVVATVGWTGASHWMTEGYTVGATVGYTWSRFGLTGSLGRFSPDYEGYHTVATAGVTSSFRLLGGTLDTPFQINLLGGLGSALTADNPLIPGFSVPGGDSDWRAQAGIGVTLSIATPVVSIRPWLAPRAEIIGRPDGSSESLSTEFAGSAGVDLAFLGGLGLRATWDKIEGDDQAIGFGISYRF